MIKVCISLNRWNSAMSNDISSRQDGNQAENSEENSSNESKTWEEIEKSIGMTRDELIERSKSSNRRLEMVEWWGKCKTIARIWKSRS